MNASLLPASRLHQSMGWIETRLSRHGRSLTCCSYYLQLISMLNIEGSVVTAATPASTAEAKAALQSATQHRGLWRRCMRWQMVLWMSPLLEYCED